MSEAESNLQSRFERHWPTDDATRACWPWLLSAIELGWFDHADLEELLVHLRAGRDFGIQELHFEHLEGRLRVSFLGDNVWCAPATVVVALAAVLRN